MIEKISAKEWQMLPEYAQREVRDFYLFVKTKYADCQEHQQRNETMFLSEDSLAEDWLNPEEDKTWSEYQ